MLHYKHINVVQINCITNFYKKKLNELNFLKMRKLL